MPSLSALGAIGTVLLLYGTGERLYDVGASDSSGRDKLTEGATVSLIGAAFVIAAGFFTMMTHLCP